MPRQRVGKRRPAVYILPDRREHFFEARMRAEVGLGFENLFQRHLGIEQRRGFDGEIHQLGRADPAGQCATASAGGSRFAGGGQAEHHQSALLKRLNRLRFAGRFERTVARSSVGRDRSIGKPHHSIIPTGLRAAPLQPCWRRKPPHPSPTRATGACLWSGPTGGSVRLPPCAG